MCAVNRPGFSFIEIIIAMAVIAVMALFVAPQFKRPKDEVHHFFVKLQTMVNYGLYRAVTEQKAHRLFFKFTTMPSIELQEASAEKDSSGNAKYVPLHAHAGVITEISIPKNMEFKQLYINSIDVIPGGITRDAWANITTNGLIQPLIINSRDVESDHIYACTINSVTGQLTVHHEPQRP